MRLSARCPSIFSSIAIELNVPRDEFSSIAIEPTVSIAFRRGFKKAGSVLSDIGDSWDKYVVITRWTTGGYDIFITCPAKSMHRESEGLEVHAFCGTGDENTMPTCREASN